MARLSRRTVEPAKVSACQSAENDWTRWKPSSVISFMLAAASGFQNRKLTLRMIAKAR